jgi:hypothetical protein
MILYDTPEFIAAEAERKAQQLSDMRMGEYYQRESALFHAKHHSRDEGITIAVRSIWTPDWSEQHEA